MKTGIILNPEGTKRMNVSIQKHVACGLFFGLAVSTCLAAGELSFDPTKALKDYAGNGVEKGRSRPGGL
jgi:hypothetical protein